MILRRRARARRGFTLLESLIGMLISFMIIGGSLEFFGTSARVFSRLLGRQENRQAAWAALDRIRSDVRGAGRGLSRAIRLGIVPGFEESAGRWILTAAEAAPALIADPPAGASVLAVSNADEDWIGRGLCLCGESGGEIAVIAGAGEEALALAAPLQRSYRAGETSLAVLRKITLYLDAGSGILRRKIDASPAQPLLEGVETFVLSAAPGDCLVQARLSFISAPEEFYVLKILARNTALARTR